MKKWIMKAIVQKVVSHLPAAHKINYLVHKHITIGKELSEDFFLDRLSHFTNHYQFLKKYHANPGPELNVLELGTGWHPIVPVAFFLSGHTDIITIDIRPQLYPEMVQQTLNWFLKLNEDGRLRFAPWQPGAALVTNQHGIPEPDVPEGALLEPDAMALVVLPLVGFDTRGHRLGMGGGWYDRSFAFRQSKKAPPWLVGAALSLQLIDALAPASWDVAMDAVCSEHDTHLFEAVSA